MTQDNLILQGSIFEMTITKMSQARQEKCLFLNLVLNF